MNDKNKFKDQTEVLIRVREAAKLLGATELNRPEDIEEFFFKDKHSIENIMKSGTIIIFHCEFS